MRNIQDYFDTFVGNKWIKMRAALSAVYNI